MKSSEICRLAIQIVTGQFGEVQYRRNNTTELIDASWNNMTWYSGAWHSDCLGFVRACICNWRADKTKLYGGSDADKYLCWNYNEPLFINSCSYRSKNFTEIEQHPCSLLYKQGHVGLYVGDYTCTIDGVERTCNACEVSLGLGAGGIPSYVTPEGGRCLYKGAYVGDYWTDWGTFNNGGRDYPVIEFDGGGSVGYAGIGTALSQAEVDNFWISTQTPSGDYLIALIQSLYEVDEDMALCCLGWAYGEGYQFYDTYMGYLCNSIPFNRIKAYGADTADKLARSLGGGDTSSFYSATQMKARGQTALGDSELAELARHSVLLACLNPNQRAWGCNGVDRPTQEQLIYSKFINGFTINAYSDIPVRYWDTTGLGIRGGLPPQPENRTQRGMPVWMMLRPWYHINQHRLFRL